MFDGITDPYLLRWLWESYYSQIVIPQLTNELKRFQDYHFGCEYHRLHTYHYRHQTFQQYLAYRHHQPERFHQKIMLMERIKGHTKIR